MVVLENYHSVDSRRRTNQKREESAITADTDARMTLTVIKNQLFLIDFRAA